MAAPLVTESVVDSAVAARAIAPAAIGCVSTASLSPPTSPSVAVLAATTVERPVAEVSAGFVLLLLRSAASLSAAVARHASRPFLGSLGKEAAAGAGGRKVLTFSRSRIRSKSWEFRVRGWMVAGRRPVRLMQFPHRPGSQEWQHLFALRQGQAVASPQLALREHSQHTVRRCLDRLENRVGESAVSSSSGLSPSRDRDRLHPIVAGGRVNQPSAGPFVPSML